MSSNPVSSGRALVLIPVLILALALALVLSACTSTSFEDGSEAEEAHVVTPDIPQQEVRAAPEMHLNQLLGLDADQLTALLGPADFRRADGPAEIWQYRNGECVLDLFLYTDPTAGDLHVKHVEVRDRATAASAGGSDCATALLRQRRQRAG